MTKKTFLDKAYHIGEKAGIKSLYADWAESYEAEITENGYATPARMADALAKLIDDKTISILDFGCGTGLSGLAFQHAGFTSIHGADPSPEMLTFAETKGLYQTLTELDVKTSPPFAIGKFDVIAAVGVVGTGAAPVEVLDDLLALLTKGQKLIFSFNDHTLEAPEFPTRVETFITSGSVNLVLKEYGDHLPGVGLKSMIYVLEKR
jgi:predicted TPR repeat methyltransferase